MSFLPLVASAASSAGLRLALTGAPPVIIPFDVYADSVNGNDSNSGLSPELAKKTLAALPSQAADQRIGLAKGSLFREQLELANAGMYVGAYGLGDEPHITGANLITSWSKTSGKTFVYEATLTCALGSIDSSIYPRAWENGAALSRVATTALVDSTAASYTITGTYPTYTLYVHATGDGNPASNGSSYEASTRLHGIHGGETVGELTVKGIKCSKPAHMDGALVLRGRRVTMEDCLAYDGSKHNIFGGSGTMRRCAARYAEYNAAKTLGVFFLTDPQGDSFLVDDCDFEWSLTDLLALNNCSGIIAHRGASTSTWRLAEFRNTRPKYCSTGFSVSSADQVRITDCDATDCKSFAAASADSPVTVSGGSITCQASLDQCNIFFTVESNATIEIGDGFRWVAPRTNVGAIFANFDNSTILIGDVRFTDTNKAAYVTAVQSHANGVSISVSGAYFNGCDQMFDVSSGVSLTSDDNTVGSSTIANTINGTSYASLSSYAAATGNDVHTTVGTIPV